MAKAIMIQGAGTNVGKSLIVAGLARACLRRGISVAPFKPQNMSNNAAVTEDGAEIGRAQALQARAAGRAPAADMNPVLLKPESDTGAQVIVQGQRFATLKARDYGSAKAKLLPRIMGSFKRIAASADLVLVEGAGSPAEINLRDGDIANMGFAEAACLPVVLVGDIDRGGVIAQIVGTREILSEADRSRIVAFLINKFRGDLSLFDDGMAVIAERTGWTGLGILPWFDDAWRLPAEDIADIRSAFGGSLKVVVPRLGRIANFDDLDPLAAEPNVTVEIVEPGRALPGDADLVLLPGSKSTIADLEHFRAQGWDIDLTAHIRRGGHVLGICGGYQMLGRMISDPEGIEGPKGSVSGLGHLDVETEMRPKKRLAKTEAVYCATGDAVHGYEIHIGHTSGPDCGRAWLRVGDRPEGASDASGLIRGCYLHGLFESDRFRSAYLDELGICASGANFGGSVDEALDLLGEHFERHMDIDQLLNLAARVA